MDGMRASQEQLFPIGFHPQKIIFIEFLLCFIQGVSSDLTHAHIAIRNYGTQAHHRIKGESSLEEEFWGN